MPQSIEWLIGSRVTSLAPDNGHSWFIRFSSRGVLRIDTLWRVVADGRVAVTSRDHGHPFGLETKTDAGALAMAILGKVLITQAHVADHTGDFVLQFGNCVRLEVLTASSGYESWSLVSPQGDETIGLGGGGTCVIEKGRPMPDA